MGIKFDLDPCTTEDNPLDTPEFYTPKIDGLRMPWAGKKAFVNPPYSRHNIDRWVSKCRREAVNQDTLVVGLLPLRTALWFRANILPGFKVLRGLEEWRDLKHGEVGVFFLEKRVRFIDPETGVRVKSAPTWDTIIVIWV